MKALVATEAGTWEVDLDEEALLGPADDPFPGANAPIVALPRVLAAAASGSTVVAVLDRKPPLAVSHDAGTTWSESGRGLPGGRAVAIHPDEPDTILYGARNRLYLSTDGGRFWRALALELPAVEAVAFAD
ncbi:MAG: WD40/YVTN/BNR-like repeat-containing protein [Pseudomonadota bacterium]